MQRVWKVWFIVKHSRTLLNFKRRASAFWSALERSGVKYNISGVGLNNTWQVRQGKIACASSARLSRDYPSRNFSSAKHTRNTCNYNATATREIISEKFLFYKFQVDETKFPSHCPVTAIREIYFAIREDEE